MREAIVGIGTAKARNVVAVAESGQSGEIRYLAEFENAPDAVIQLVQKTTGRCEIVHFCYEPGPTRYVDLRPGCLDETRRVEEFVLTVT